MLIPSFSERRALEIRDRIIKYLQAHFLDKENWGPYYLTWNSPKAVNHYSFPTVNEFANFGTFDDVAESVFLRVLKDMNNLGTIALVRDDDNPAMSNSEVRLCERLLEPILGDAHLSTNGQYCKTLEALDSK
jgi:hypothetical protein